jgi:hypothetical protein
MKAATKLDVAHSIKNVALDLLERGGQPIDHQGAKGKMALLADDIVIQCVDFRGRTFLDIYGRVHNGNRHKVLNMTWEPEQPVPVLVSFRRGPWEQILFEEAAKP